MTTRTAQAAELAQLLGPREVAALLNIAPRTVYAWVQDGTIPFYRIGRLVRFDPKELRGWLDERKSA